MPIRSMIAGAFLSMAAVIAGVTGIGGVVAEYTGVGVTRAVEYCKGQIPPSVELDRLERKIAAIDREIATNADLVAAQAVSLDREEATLAEKEAVVQRATTTLRALRDKLTCVEAGDARRELTETLRKGAERLKLRVETVGTMRGSLQRKRSGYETLFAAFEKQKEDRQILADRLDSLRTEHASLKMRGELEGSALVDSASSRAKKLADELDAILTVQRRAAELRSEESEFALDGAEMTEQFFDPADLDSLLGQSAL